VYFCCVEATRTGAASIGLSTTSEDLVLRVIGDSGEPRDLQTMLDRVAAAGGVLSADPGVLTVTLPLRDDQPAYGLTQGVGPGLG
jgi:hypothetical protein